MSDDTRSKILNILRTKRSSIEDLEKKLDKQGISISQTAIRQHLTQLENNEKSIGKKAIREGKGRPRYIYYVKQESASAYPKRYSFLLQLVLNKLIDENGKEDVERLLSEVAREHASRYDLRLKGLTNDEKVKTVVEILHDLETFPELELTGDNEITLKIHNCVFYEAARNMPELCSFDKEFISRLLGPNSTQKRTTCIRSGDPQCTYEITME